MIGIVFQRWEHHSLSNLLLYLRWSHIFDRLYRSSLFDLLVICYLHFLPVMIVDICSSIYLFIKLSHFYHTYTSLSHYHISLIITAISLLSFETKLWHNYYHLQQIHSILAKNSLKWLIWTYQFNVKITS